MKSNPKIVFCHCAHGDVVSPAARRGVLAQLREAGAAFEAVADLCGLAARRDPALREIAEAGDVRIAACFPRAVRWLFHAAGAALAPQGVTIANMRTQAPGQVAGRLLAGVETPGAAPGPPEERLAPKPDEWIPWFPVLDYDRCKDCKQCLSFCLFGVYALSADGRVEVRNPEKCKTNCPACARICPEAAVIFPKYKTAPINGDEVKPEDLKHPTLGVDVQSLLGGDVYAKLRVRGGASSPFSPGPDGGATPASGTG